MEWIEVFVQHPGRLVLDQRLRVKMFSSPAAARLVLAVAFVRNKKLQGENG